MTLSSKLIAVQGFGFTPVALAVQGLIDFIVAGGTTTPTNEISLDIVSKRVYLKRGKKYLIFDTPEEADAWESAETMANAAIEKAQKTSRMARNRVKRKIYSAAPIPEVIDSSALSFLASKFAPELDIEPLIQDNDVSELERIYLILKDRQEEEDIELLLLA